MARAFLLWGPSKNFQHLEAIADLKRAIALQNNLPHAYNRLGSILAHIGLLDHSRAMFERGRPFQPRKAVSPSIVQVYVCRAGIRPDAPTRFRPGGKASPGNKYPLYFAPYPTMMTGDWKRGESPHGGSVAILRRTIHSSSAYRVLYSTH